MQDGRTGKGVAVPATMTEQTNTFRSMNKTHGKLTDTFFCKEFYCFRSSR